MKIRFLSMGARKTKLVLCTVLAVTMLAINASPALALKYWRAGKEYQSSGSSQRWTGGHGYNYVMNNPTITWRHVNSMYIDRIFSGGHRYYYEIGWVWMAGFVTPNWFWAKMIDNVYYGPYFVGNPSPNTNHLLSVQIEPSGNVQMKVDSTVKREESSAFFPDGVIIWGSERQNLNESNYAHFWHLMKRRHDYVWDFWGDHREYIVNPDPGYHWEGPTDTEGFSRAN